MSPEPLSRSGWAVSRWNLPRVVLSAEKYTIRSLLVLTKDAALIQTFLPEVHLFLLLPSARLLHSPADFSSAAFCKQYHTVVDSLRDLAEFVIPTVSACPPSPLLLTSVTHLCAPLKPSDVWLFVGLISRMADADERSHVALLRVMRFGWCVCALHVCWFIVLKPKKERKRIFCLCEMVSQSKQNKPLRFLRVSKLGSYRWRQPTARLQ